ncbi:MAG: GHKL domain-containing protein [Lachnospiraceae bacterium]|nr:GHKL domain-containing protein [Lachnospiraceae bacterium]
MRQQTAQILMWLLTVTAAAMVGLTFGGIRGRASCQGSRGLLPFRIGLAAVIGTDTAGVALLAGRILTCSALSVGSRAAAGGFLAVGCLFVLSFLAFHPVSLFPEESATLNPADGKQQRRLRLCLWSLLVEYIVYGGWLIFLLCLGRRMSAAAMAATAFLAALSMIFLLWKGRQSVETTYERIETLVDKQYQAELLNFMQVIRAQRHDFNIHLQAVVGMIESGRYEDCAGYAREMAKSAERLNDVLPLDNPIIGAQINAFQEIAAVRHIRLETQILNELKNLPCTIYEANIVLGNLLQNAIDEVGDGEIDSRWVKVLTMKRSRRHIIKVSNPCDKKPEDYEDIFQMGYSTKQSHEGIGLVSVRKIVTKYGGVVYLEHEPGIVHFIVKIPEKSEARG